MSDLHVGFDSQIIRRQGQGGISRYFSELSAQLIAAGLHVSHEQPTRLFRTGYRAWRHADVIHGTFYGGAPYRLKPSQRLVSSLFDMVPERYPEHFLFPGLRSPHANKKSWLFASDKILSISAASADDLYFYSPVNLPPVDIIHLSTSINLLPTQSIPALEQRRFWLMIGKRQAYKNGRVLLRALAALRLTVKQSSFYPLLIFVGGGPWSVSEKRWIADHQLDHIVLQVNASDLQLGWLYKNADAVFVPSLAEGFSLPLIEALSCDTPVVASDIEAHREVSLKYATLLSPLNTFLWADWMREHAAITPEKPSLVLGRESYISLCSHYSPPRMTREHICSYQSLF